MHLIVPLITVLVLLLVFGPGLWVRSVMRKYREPEDLYPGTGAELANRLIADLDLTGVAVEEAPPDQDHYDPDTKKVRLAPDNYNGHSLTAVAVAAHEVGHALQHAQGYRPLSLRTRLARVAMLAEKLGAFALMAIPLVTLVTRSPLSGGAVLLIGVGTMAIGTLLHLVTLPVEWNASFARALPMLRDGRYIPESHLPHARKILTAAALTYVAASLASLLNLYRWIAILRR